MLREIAIIFGSVVCVFYASLAFLAPPIGWVNGLAFPGAVGYINGVAFPVALTLGVIALGVFAGLILYTGLHIKDLYSVKPKHAIAFLAILLAATLSTNAFFWWIWSQPFGI
jgi:hypothetical protein